MLIVYRVCTSVVAGGYACSLSVVQEAQILLGDADGNELDIRLWPNLVVPVLLGYNVFYQTADFLDSPNTILPQLTR